MDNPKVNIYIELSNKGIARSILAAGMYIMEYFLQNRSGEAVTIQGILIRENVTGNAMALETLHGAFSRLTKTCCVSVNMENTHISNVMENHYLPVWEKDNWIRKNGKPVANKELWQQLSGTMERHAVSFRNGENSYRKVMQFNMEKAMEAYRKGKEYHPGGLGKRKPAMSDGGYWIIW